MQSTIYRRRLGNSLQLSLNKAFGSRKGCARPRPHSYRDWVATSRAVSVLLRQESAQPLPTLYSSVATSFRDLRKQQDVGLPLVIRQRDNAQRIP
jgi:hypothetical protein